MRKQLLLWLSDEALGCTAAVAAAMSIAKFSLQLCYAWNLLLLLLLKLEL
jgi:hypothetical protein